MGMGRGGGLGMNQIMMQQHAMFTNCK
jgi:hypothetical protein